MTDSEECGPKVNDEYRAAEYRAVTDEYRTDEERR